MNTHADLGITTRHPDKKVAVRKKGVRGSAHSPRLQRYPRNLSNHKGAAGEAHTSPVNLIEE
jgi:hypothetical protein